MDVGGYRHNYEGFYEKTSYQMSINRGRTTTTQCDHASLVGILSFLLFLSWWRALKRRSNNLETAWISLEARHLNSFNNSFKETCKYVFSYILDDRIICSWCLNILNIRFNEFRCIWCLIKILESYRPQIPSLLRQEACESHDNLMINVVPKTLFFLGISISFSSILWI